jgi:hypothetical protein
MNVRAKFKVDSVNQTEDYAHVILRAVTSGSEENKTFWKYTPSGVIDMSITNPAAVAQFVEGQAYYVDFSIADEA